MASKSAIKYVNTKFTFICTIWQLHVGVNTTFKRYYNFKFPKYMDVYCIWKFGSVIIVEYILRSKLFVFIIRGFEPKQHLDNIMQ